MGKMMKTNLQHNAVPSDGKTAAVLAYCTLVGTLIAWSINADAECKTTFASFHIRQAMGIFLSFFLLGYLVGYADHWSATAAFYVFYLLQWMYGFSGVLQGKCISVPVLGAYYQKWFSKI